MDNNIYAVLARMALAGYKVCSDMIMITPETKRNGDWEKIIERTGITFEVSDGTPMRKVKERQEKLDTLEFRRELKEARLRKCRRDIARASRTKIVSKTLGVPMSEWEQAMMNYYYELYVRKY